MLFISSEKAVAMIIKYINKFPLKTKKRISFQKWVKGLSLRNLEKTANPVKLEILRGAQEKLKESINKSELT